MKLRCQDCDSMKDDVENTQADLMLCPECRNKRFNLGAPKTLTPRNIKQLSDILKIDKSEIAKVYTNCLSTVHQYAQQDIHDCLVKVDLDTLNTIHKSLCDCVIQILPQFKDRRVVNRQVKRTIVPDILSLGYSVINKAADKDLDKIFQNRDSHNVESHENLSNAQLNELLELLGTVAALGTKVDVLEKKLQDLVTENQSLKDRLSNLEQNAPPTNVNPGNEAPNSGPEHPQEDHGNGESVSNPSEGAAKTDTLEEGNDDVIITAVVKPDHATDAPSDTDSDVTDSEDNSHFILPRKYRLKLRKLEQKAAEAKLQEKERPAKVLDKNRPKALQVADNNQITKSSVTDGNRQTSNLIAASSTTTKDIYIGGVSNTNSTADIESHMSHMGITVTGMVKILSQGPVHKSFRVTVPSDSYETALHDGNWPTGITVRPFRPKNLQSRNGSRHARITAKRKKYPAFNQHDKRGYRGNNQEDYSNFRWRHRSNKKYNRYDDYEDLYYSNRHDFRQYPDQYQEYEYDTRGSEW